MVVIFLSLIQNAAFNSKGLKIEIINRTKRRYSLCTELGLGMRFNYQKECSHSPRKNTTQCVTKIIYVVYVLFIDLFPHYFILDFFIYIYMCVCVCVCVCVCAHALVFSILNRKL